MGKYPPKAGGPGLEVFPIYGEVPAEGGGWGQGWRSSPFMGKYPPKAGDGARPEGLIAGRHGPEP